MRKPIAVATLSVVLGLLALAGPAAADEPGESDESTQLVREAIALIVNTPGDMEGIEDKIVDALEAPNQEGVDLDLVAEAEEAFEREDMHEVRALLERSIGAQPHRGDRDPLPIGETRGSPGMPMASGAQTGTDVAIDELAPDRDLSGNDALGLIALVLLAGAGVWLAARFRSRPPRPEEARP
jgi:hypothetical protein